MILKGFENGINLGGWLSQYQTFSHDHFRTFITEADIARIAAWGFDHVRLPVDYPVLEDDANPGVYSEAGFGYIDNCITWCQRHNLKLVLDVHRAPGYAFYTLENNTLFTKKETATRFINLWQAIARRYAHLDEDFIILELLNEIVLPDATPWNNLAQGLITAIRAIDPLHWIMVGGNFYNAISELKNIPQFADEKIVYTFHFYEPFPFTHQKAGWVKELVAYGKTLHYPGKIEGLGEFLQQNPHASDNFPLDEHIDEIMDKEHLNSYLQDARDFLAATQKPLYCGEYGVIDQAPMQSRINWNRDFASLLKQHGIMRAYWSYKAMDFGLVDAAGKVIDENLVKAVVN